MLFAIAARRVKDVSPCRARRRPAAPDATALFTHANLICSLATDLHFRGTITAYFPALDDTTTGVSAGLSTLFPCLPVLYHKFRFANTLSSDRVQKPARKQGRRHQRRITCKSPHVSKGDVLNVESVNLPVPAQPRAFLS